MTIKPGVRVGSHEVTSTLGVGGMGVVFRARDVSLQRDVALKLLPSRFTGDADYLARFRREAQILASLNHPNIAQIYDLEQSYDGPDGQFVLLRSGTTTAAPITIVLNWTKRLPKRQ
jgi:serine/threonine protein kinase